MSVASTRKKNKKRLKNAKIQQASKRMASGKGNISDRYRSASAFQNNLTGSKKKGLTSGKVAAVKGAIAGRTYKMTQAHKDAISRALKGRKRKK